MMLVTLLRRSPVRAKAVVKRAVKDAAGAMSEVISNAAREALGGKDADEKVPTRKH